MENLLNKINKNLTDYYSSRSKSYSDSSQQVGWKSTEAQHNRFEQLIKVIKEPSNFSVNDLGCGLGDLSKYLLTKGFTEFTYNGYDMFQSMVEGAKKLYSENRNCFFYHINNLTDMKEANYTMASGVLNMKFDISENEWLEYIIETISVMNSKSRNGFAFNALTKYSDKEYMKEELYYSDPCFLFDYCKRNFAKNVALLHDYQEYDFTIIVRK